MDDLTTQSQATSARDVPTKSQGNYLKSVLLSMLLYFLSTVLSYKNHSYKPMPATAFLVPGLAFVVVVAVVAVVDGGSNMTQAKTFIVDALGTVATVIKVNGFGVNPGRSDMHLIAWTDIPAFGITPLRATVATCYDTANRKCPSGECNDVQRSNHFAS